MNKVTSVTPLPDFMLHLCFDDGMEKTVDINPFIGEGISVALQDKEYFKKVAVESGGGIYWPNGYDFCPNFLHDEVPDQTLVTA